MEYIKICATLVSAAIISVIIKDQNKSFNYLVAVTGTLIAAFFAIGCISPIIKFISGIESVNGELFGIMLRVLGVSYLTELSVSVCRDVGETSLAVGIDICGKAQILILCLPMFKELIEICVDLLK